MTLQRARRNSQILLLGLLLPVMLTPPLPQPDSTARGDFAAIDRYVVAQLAQSGVPGAALAIVRDGAIVHARGFGQADPQGRPVTPQTPFIIGSMSKPFTALAVLQLVEAGLIDLDAPVQRYLPWFRVARSRDRPEASGRITVRQLLSHTSGLPDTALMGAVAHDRGRTLDQEVRELSSVPLAAEPGTTFRYASANYLVLAMLVQTVADEPFEAYLKRRVLLPLGMTHTFLSADEVRGEALTIGYRYWFGLPLPAELPYPRALVPAAYIISTAEDLARFLIPQIDGMGTALLASESIAMMHRAGVTPPSDYGLGWWVGAYNGVPNAAPAVYHGGSTANFRTYMIMLPEGPWGVVLLLNANSNLFRYNLDDIATGVTDLLTGRPLHPGRTGLTTNYLRLTLVLVAITLAHTWTLGRLMRHGLSTQRGTHTALWRVALPLAWEWGAGLGLIFGLPHLGQASGLAQLVGWIARVPDLGDIPWPLLLVLVPDVGWWLLGFALLLLFRGSIRLSLILVSLRECSRAPRRTWRVAPRPQSAPLGCRGRALPVPSTHRGAAHVPTPGGRRGTPAATMQDRGFRW